MTDQITVPKQTWDAMLEALELCEDSLNSVGLTITASIANEALTAANAVSAEPKVKLIPTAEELGRPVQPQKAASDELRTTEQIVLDMEVWFEAQEPMPDSMTAAKEFARRIRNQTEQDIAKVIQRRGWELMRSESGYFLRDATAAEAQ